MESHVNLTPLEHDAYIDAKKLQFKSLKQTEKCC